jgi:hypothetical protein
MARRKSAKKAKKKAAAKPAARRSASKSMKKAAKKPAAKKAKKAKKAAKPAKKAAPARRAVARKPAPKAKAAPKKAAAKKAAPKKAAPKAVAPKLAAPKRAAAPAKKANLDRPRKTVADIHGIPSSLDLNRSPSAARTGRAEMNERLSKNTNSSPALTSGDVDADWESAAAVGDEAPGGDNPTPDQDVVDDIGRALGVEYADDEELQGGDEIADRDRHRWELDPSSKDDFDDED